MKIKFSENFYFLLTEIINFIAKDKPQASKKFKTDLLKSIRKDLKFPYNYKKSTYFDSYLYRDYIHKGYTITYEIDEKEKFITIIGKIKNKKTY